jgi:Zn-dependent protease with chaperone function
MHLIMLVIALGIAWYVRKIGTASVCNWEDRWQKALRLFLFSPLLLFTTTLSVIWMGPHGQMASHWEGGLSYSLAIGFLGFALLGWVKLIWQGRRMLQKVQAYPTTTLCGKMVRVINTPNLYSAQVGFWQPELVMSQGLFDTLDDVHLEAVLIHEQAHSHYQDTFWFFWLGWIRQMTAWLPQTEFIWQELLTLRELRADRWASQQTDALLVAEALLLVVSNSLFCPESFGAAFCNVAPPNRFTQRIEALLTEVEPIHPYGLWTWAWLVLTLLPLLAIPFHT